MAYTSKYILLMSIKEGAYIRVKWGLNSMRWAKVIYNDATNCRMYLDVKLWGKFVTLSREVAYYNDSIFEYVEFTPAKELQK